MRRWLLLAATACALAPAPALGTTQAARHVDCVARTVTLYGVVDASPGPDYALPYGLLVDVDSANAAGHAYAKAAQPVTVLVTSSTRISGGGGGATTLGALEWSERVAVAARVCPAKLARGATPTLAARSVAVQR